MGFLVVVKSLVAMMTLVASILIPAPLLTDEIGVKGWEVGTIEPGLNVTNEMELKRASEEDDSCPLDSGYSEEEVLLTLGKDTGTSASVGKSSSTNSLRKDVNEITSALEGSVDGGLVSHMDMENTSRSWVSKG